MSNDTTSDGTTTADDKTSGTAKLELLSKEELIKIIKNQFLLKRKLETKINDLTKLNTEQIQNEQELRKQIDAEQSKYSKLMNEFEQSKLQEELQIAHKSLDHLRLQNEVLETSCKNLQNEISDLQNKLSTVEISLINESDKASSNSQLLSKFLSITINSLQLPMNLSNDIDDGIIQQYKNELEQKQENIKQLFEHMEQEKVRLNRRIEDLEFLNEEIKLEVDDLRLKSINYQRDRKLMENEIDNYRRQIEDFEEQFLELQRESNYNRSSAFDKSSQQSSMSTLHQIDDNTDEIISQCMDYILNQIDSNNQKLSRATSTSSLLLSSDIPTLLHSIGIANSTEEDFSVPLSFESVLRLCTLLIERCRVLQYILLKNNDLSINSLSVNDYNKDCILFLQSNGWEQCKICVHKEDNFILDTVFERIHNEMHQTITCNDWYIIIERPIDQKTSPYIRIAFNNIKFVPEDVERDLSCLQSQYDRILKENEKQKERLLELETRLHSNNTYERLKERQTQLEEQLAQQCQKTIELENILKQENIDKSKIHELKQLESSYNELQEKYLIATQLEEQLTHINQNLNEKELELKRQCSLFERLKHDYDQQHVHLLERDEHIRLLKLEIEQQEKSKENIIENYQNQLKQFHTQIENQKVALMSAAQNQDKIYSSKFSEQNELNDLVQMKTNENQQLQNDLNRCYESILEKDQQIETYEKQLNIEKDAWKIKIHEIEKENVKLNNEIQNIQLERSQLIQNICDLKQQLEINSKNTDQERQQTVESIKTESQFNEVQVHNLQMNSSTNNIEIRQNILVDEHSSQSNETRKEADLHNQTTKETLKNQSSDSTENFQELKEKYHKMKVLLTRLKKELQDKNHQQPKQSLIDLELADYEKTIQHFKDDLLNKDKEIQDLQDELKASVDKYTCLKIENKNLEQQIEQIEGRANKFKALLEMAKKELKNAKDLELQRHSNDDHVREIVETLQNDVYSKTMLINDLQNEKQQLIEKLNNHTETTQRTINLLEQNLRIASHDLNVAKQDYDTLQDDFNNYKIRAQCVLKQQQSHQRDRIPSIVDKQHELEETVEKLNKSLTEADDKMQSLISDNDALQKERDRLVEIQTKLMVESKKREQDLRKQHKLEIDQIENDYLQRLNDSDDRLKIATMHTETLSTAFKEQIATMESEHERSISVLQNELEISRQDMEQLKIRIELIHSTKNDNEKLPTNPDSSPIGIDTYSNRDDIPACSNCEFQQGEESASFNTIHQTMHDNILYNAPNMTYDTSVSTNHVNVASSTNHQSHDSLLESIQNERKHLDDELSKTKLLLLNANELLNESETNNERLVEQVKLLKDEIRRIERNMDRAESISNMEYLKNVILKFFILKCTHERLQLIPVLVTMLKLSPDEQEQLIRVANSPTTIEELIRNNDDSQQETRYDPAPSSWSSFLHIW